MIHVWPLYQFSCILVLTDSRPICDKFVAIFLNFVSFFFRFLLFLFGIKQVNDKGQLRLSRRGLLPAPETTEDNAGGTETSGDLNKDTAASPKAEEKVERSKDRISSAKLMTSSKVNSTDGSETLQKKIFRRVKKSSGKAISGVSGKDEK